MERENTEREKKFSCNKKYLTYTEREFLTQYEDVLKLKNYTTVSLV